MNGPARVEMRPLEPNTLLVHVNKIVDEAIDIKSFELVSADGQLFPSFTPGSHIDVHIAFGLIRAYSLCNGPDNTQSYLIAVKKEAASRGGSHAMHEKIKVGDTLLIGVPRNHFSLIPQAKRHLLLGGGIGITPLLSMARHLLESGGDFELHYFSRSVKHTAFHAVFSGPEFKDKVVFHHALEADAVRACLRELLESRPEGAHLYLCGPKFFMDEVQAAAAAAWPAQAVHLEHFAADPMALAGPQGAFEVRLARSGGTYAIPEGQSIVDVLAQHGIQIEVSCEQGVCGTCMTGVVSGTPDHRDVFLSPEEKAGGDVMLPCVSRCKSPQLVLDL